MYLDSSRVRWLEDNGLNVAVEKGLVMPELQLSSDDNITRGLMKNLEGRLLTLIEATTSDKTQREALKSLVRQNIWEWRAMFKRIQAPQTMEETEE